MSLLIFDLDGTLIDSKLDLANSVNAARAHMGLSPLAHQLIYSYVGNGAPTLIRRAMGPEAGEAEVEKALEFFIRFYAQNCLENTTLYPGVQETLDHLQRRGEPMAILTNKPVRISNQIVRELGLSSHFFQVYGGNSFEWKKPHPAGVEALLAETGEQRENTVMVGDSAVDILTARNAGIRACGVMYGFQPEGFREAPPDITVEELGELIGYIDSFSGRPPEGRR